MVKKFSKKKTASKKTKKKKKKEKKNVENDSYQVLSLHLMKGPDCGEIIQSSQKYKLIKLTSN